MLLRENSQSEKAIFSMILTIWYSGKGEIVEIIERAVVSQGSGGGNKDEQGAQSTFRVVETLLYDTVMMDTWCNTSINCATWRVNPNAKYGL